MINYSTLRKLILALLFANPLSASAEQIQFSLLEKQFSLEVDSNFIEAPRPNRSVLLALRDRNGYPTLNAIVIASTLPEDLNTVQSALLNDYRAVGLQDASVGDLERVTLMSGLSVVTASASFSAGDEKIESRLLVIPYAQHQVLFTFLFKASDKQNALPRWERIQKSITGPAQTTPEVKEKTTTSYLYYLLPFIAGLFAFSIYRKRTLLRENV